MTQLQKIERRLQEVNRDLEGMKRFAKARSNNNLECALILWGEQSYIAAVKERGYLEWLKSGLENNSIPSDCTADEYHKLYIRAKH